MRAALVAEHFIPSLPHVHGTDLIPNQPRFLAYVPPCSFRRSNYAMRYFGILALAIAFAAPSVPAVPTANPLTEPARAYEGTTPPKAPSAPTRQHAPPRNTSTHEASTPPENVLLALQERGKPDSGYVTNREGPASRGASCTERREKDFTKLTVYT